MVCKTLIDFFPRKLHFRLADNIVSRVPASKTLSAEKGEKKLLKLVCFHASEKECKVTGSVSMLGFDETTNCSKLLRCNHSAIWRRREISRCTSGWVLDGPKGKMLMDYTSFLQSRWWNFQRRHTCAKLKSQNYSICTEVIKVIFAFSPSILPLVDN